MTLVPDLSQLYYKGGAPNFLTEGSSHLSPEAMGLEGSWHQVPEWSYTLLLSQARALRAAGSTHLSCWDPLYKKRRYNCPGEISPKRMQMSRNVCSSLARLPIFKISVTSKLYLLVMLLCKWLISHTLRPLVSSILHLQTQLFLQATTKHITTKEVLVTWTSHTYTSGCFPGTSITLRACSDSFVFLSERTELYAFLSQN